MEWKIFKLKIFHKFEAFYGFHEYFLYNVCGAYGCHATVEDWNEFSKKCLLRLLSFIEILLLLRVLLVCTIYTNHGEGLKQLHVTVQLEHFLIYIYTYIYRTKFVIEFCGSDS